MKLLSVLNIEASWPLCVLFFLSLLLFLVVLFTGTIHTTPEHHKNPLFFFFLKTSNHLSFTNQNH